MMTAASLSSFGASPLAEISACCVVRQLSLVAICAPVESNTFHARGKVRRRYHAGRSEE
jgi:hypothetical protein